MKNKKKGSKLKQTYEVYQNHKITRNLQKSLVFSSGNKTSLVYTSPVKFLNGRIFYLCNQFIRNSANSVTDYSTVCCSKTCRVPLVPSKRKVDPCKFLSVQKFVRPLCKRGLRGRLFLSLYLFFSVPPKVVSSLRSLYVSGKLPTDPSPKPTLALTSQLRQNVGLGEA